MIGIQPKHLITLLDYNNSQINHFLDIGKNVKADHKKNGSNDLLKGKTSVLFFEKPSLRTRVTFEVAMAHVGGTTVNLEPSSVSLGKRETVEDAGKNLSRWVDVIVARTFKHTLVEELKEHCSIPVINALTDLYHPCQALAFGMTLQEQRGNLDGANLVFVGDGNNVANSLAAICPALGMNFTLACPKGYEQPESVRQVLKKLFSDAGLKYTVVNNPMEGVKNADIIYTDVWVSMGEENQKEQKGRHFEGYQVNEALMAQAPQGCLVSHCLPAHRGEEIVDSVIDSGVSICFDEAENRLHAQKAVLLALLHEDYVI